MTNHRVKTNGPFIRPGAPVQARFYTNGAQYTVTTVPVKYR